MKKALLLLVIGLFLGISVVAAYGPSVEYSGVQAQISTDAGLVSTVYLEPTITVAMENSIDQVLTTPTGFNDNRNLGYALLLAVLAATGTYYLTRNRQFIYNLKDGYRTHRTYSVQEVSTPWWKPSGEQAVA